MLEIEHRPSASPCIARVWRAHSTGVDTMTSVANSTWELVMWNEGTRLLTAVRGPETRARPAAVPQDSRTLGSRIAHAVRRAGFTTKGVGTMVRRDDYV